MSKDKIIIHARGHGYAAIIKEHGYAASAIPQYKTGMAYETDAVNIIDVQKYLRVTPESSATIVWAVPGNEIVYDIESNTDWNIT